MHDKENLEETEVAHSLQQPASWLKFSVSTSVSAATQLCMPEISD